MDEGSPPRVDLSVDVDCTHRNQQVRKVAYKNLLCQFQKLHPLSKKWNSYKSVIGKIALENSPSIREQALEVVLMFVQRCGTANESSHDVLSSLLDKKQASLEGRAEKLMIKIALHYAEMGSLECVIEQLIRAASHIHEVGNKVPATCLRIVTRILSEFGADGFNISNILDTLQNLHSTGDQEFRSAVKALMLELLVWLGKGSIKNMELILNPEELESVLKQYESMNAVSYVRQESDYKSTLMVEHELHLLEELDKTFFQNLKSGAWAKRRVALQELGELLDSGTKLPVGNYDTLLIPLKKIILNDQSPIVVDLAINCVKGIAIGLQQDFSPYAAEFCRVMMEKFGESRVQITEKLRETLEVIVTTTSFESLIKTIDRYLGHHNPTIRLEAVQLVTKLFKKSTRQTMIKKEFAVLFKSLANCLYHRQPIIMENSLKAFSVALDIAGKNIVMPYLENVDPITKRKIKNYKQEHEDSLGEKYNEIKYRNFKKESSRNVGEIINRYKDRYNCSKGTDSFIKNCKVTPEKKEWKNPNCRLQISSSSSTELYFLKSEIDESLNANDTSTMAENRVVNSKSFEQPLDGANMQRSTNNYKTKREIFLSSGKTLDRPSHENNKFVNEIKKENDPYVSASKRVQQGQNRNISTNLKSISSEQENIDIVKSMQSSEELVFSNEVVDIDTAQEPPGINDSSNAKTGLLQPSMSLVIPKHPEGYIMFTEDEFKKLLGLKKCHGNYSLSDDSSNLVQEWPPRKRKSMRPCDINVYVGNSLEKETQTTCDSNDEDTKPGMWQDKTIDEIPTQTSKIALKEKGTNAYRTKRYNRGTQWVEPPLALNEVQTQTPTVNTVEMGTGPEITRCNEVTWSSSELATVPSNRNKIEHAHTKQKSPDNIKSILTKKVEIKEQPQKDHQKRIDINTSEGGNMRKVHDSNKILDINAISTSKSNNPFHDKSRYENTKLKVQTKGKPDKKTKCDPTSSKKEKIHEKHREKNKNEPIESAKYIQDSNHKRTDRCCERKLLRSSSTNALLNSEPLNEKRRKSTAALKTSQNIHPLSPDKLVNEEHVSNSLKHTRRNETTIRLNKSEPSNTKSRFRSKSTLSKNRNEEPFIKSFDVNRSKISLINHSVHKPSSFRNSSTKKYPTFRHPYLSDSSTGSLREGCNWLTLVRKIGEREGKDKKNIKGRQYWHKRYRNGQKLTGSRTNHMKRVSSHPNEHPMNRRQKRSSPEECKYNNKKGNRKRVQTVDMTSVDTRTLDPKAKKFLVSELLRLCDISQKTFNQMVRHKASRPCLFTPKSILQRVNAAEPCPPPDSKGDSVRDLGGCILM